jgi:hypothetical protein
MNGHNPTQIGEDKVEVTPKIEIQDECNKFNYWGS